MVPTPEVQRDERGDVTDMTEDVSYKSKLYLQTMLKRNRVSRSTRKRVSSFRTMDASMDGSDRRVLPNLHPAQNNEGVKTGRRQDVQIWSNRTFLSQELPLKHKKNQTSDWKTPSHRRTLVQMQTGDMGPDLDPAVRVWCPLNQRTRSISTLGWSNRRQKTYFDL